MKTRITKLLSKGLLVAGLGLMATDADAQWTNSGNNVWTGGNVGVNIEDPKGRLHIGDGLSNAAHQENWDVNAWQSDLLKLQNWSGTVGSYAGIGFYDNGNELMGRLGFIKSDGSNGRGDFFINVSNGGVQRALHITKEANTGLGTITPNARLHVGGSAIIDQNLTLKGKVLENLEIASTMGHEIELSGGNNASIFAHEDLFLMGGTNHAVHIGAYNNQNAMYVNANGKVGIGVTDNMPGDYNLYVTKGILTERVKVASQGGTEWPDFVFADSYELKSLEEVESFIEENHHLPEVPSAEEISKDGVDVYQMEATLLQKIEELTLYMIEQNKLIKAQADRIEDLEKAIN